MIYSLLQDRHGFLWFGTKDGINRYDGYGFQKFQHNPFNPFSISDNEVLTLLEDRLGRIWAGTANDGLNVFDPKNGRFYHIRNLSNSSVFCLTEDHDGAVWVGTKYGANRVRIPEDFDRNAPDLSAVAKVDTFFWESAGEESLLSPNRFHSILLGNDGKLWLSTNLSWGYVDPVTMRYEVVEKNPNPRVGSVWNAFFKPGTDGSVWVGMPDKLLRIYNGRMESYPFQDISAQPYIDIVFNVKGDLIVSTRKLIYTLSAQHIGRPETARFNLLYRFPEGGVIGSTQILLDRGGLLWVGTNGYGLLKYNPGNPHFYHYLPGRSPRRLFHDAQGRLWVWHSFMQFRRLDETENRTAEALFESADYYQHDCIQTRNGWIWLLCENRLKPVGDCTLLKINAETLREEARYLLPINISMYSRIEEGHDGALWILGGQSNLLLFEPESSQSKVFEYGSETGFVENGFCITPDANGQVWVSTPHGLVQAVPEGERMVFVVYKNRPHDTESLSNNFVLNTLNDPAEHKRYLWVGTKGGGLNRLDKQTGKFKSFTTAEGLPNNVVYAILPDETGALWLSTNAGISRFRPQNASFQNYFKVDGLQDDEFNTLSYTRAPDGRMFFGGVNGITAFYPSALKARAITPPVFITRLKINNLPMNVGEAILPNALEYTTAVTLDHTQNQLTFEFAALDFAAPLMNQYRYRLLGAEEKWVEATTSNSATYAHLAPGHYVFEVITGGSRGVWEGEPARLEITILPPWWRTTWAYALYVGLVGLGVVGFWRFQINKIRLQSKLAFEQREAQRLAELDKLKTEFFSSVTHEFRTPLTLLLEPARQLSSTATEPSTRYRLELIENNAQRLLQFVNQLLDLSKLEAGQMPLDLRPGNIVASTRAVVERFKPLAEQKAIALHVHLPEEPLTVVFDEIKWEQIVTNLLSNALKFTDRGGQVSISLEGNAMPGNTGEWLICLRVTDTGPGIPPEEQSRVFGRFYQVPASSAEKRAVGGTGIGLSLSKELIERMGGTISVESPAPGSTLGSVFMVQLPCKASAAEAHTGLPGVDTVAGIVTDHTKAGVEMPDFESGQQETQPLLLLIEDDTELRKFVRASLPARYRVVEAADGAEGISKAIELVPDLVISDLVMPRKDGFSVAEELKNNPGTSHIPLILLTAKSAIESKIQGLRHGADVYLNKPFRADELEAHIENLLLTRQRLQAYFSQNGTQKPMVETAREALLPHEAEFLQRLVGVIEMNLENDAMDADAYARAMFVSRSQLHRKISALTGLSLTEFVRNHRLDRAREMLIKREGSVAEIAWRTGFPNAKYFSTTFKERFGETPSAVFGKNLM